MSLRQLGAGQSPYALLNALIEALSPAAVHAVDEIGVTGTTLAVFGGNVLSGGAITALANQTSIALSDNATNYVEINPSDLGTASGVTVNTTAFTAGRIPIATIVCASGAVTSITKHRFVELNPRAAISMTSDANKTLSYQECLARILDVTSTASLTATRNIVLPLVPRLWIVGNLTTGAQSLQFIGATGTGVTVGNGKRCLIYADGTNIARATADV